MNREDSALEIAAKRLDRAVALLEQRQAQSPNSGDSALFDQDRARLAAELDQSRAREKELEAAGSQASVALTKAIAEIQAVIAERGEA